MGGVYTLGVLLSHFVRLTRKKVFKPHQQLRQFDTWIWEVRVMALSFPLVNNNYLIQVHQEVKKVLEAELNKATPDFIGR